MTQITSSQSFDSSFAGPSVNPISPYNTSLNIEYPDLPVVKLREEFLKLLENNQCLIVQADTGSGKTTQIPKFCLEALELWQSKTLTTQNLTSNTVSSTQTINSQTVKPFRTRRDAPLKVSQTPEEPKMSSNVLPKPHFKRIACTQPRRLAALSITDRLREELKEDSWVGAKIRFHEDCPPDAKIKVMTDGILLQEYKQDPLLREYQIIVLDEAHERSLNIDILIGILKDLLKKRPDLKLIITSATIDASKFSEFFGKAPVLSAEGRMFPVKVEYWNPEAWPDSSDDKILQMAEQAILDLMTTKADHLLCFLATEREIQELSKVLSPALEGIAEVYGLFGRLSPMEQKRIFNPSSKPKVILSTNIAETSLTIPGIAYVVDAGMARISRYNPQSRMECLPIEKVSQASCNQRMGRAGRVKPGKCIRLYSEEDFESREFYTPPEILRSNLAHVVLLLKSLGLSPEQMNFIDEPNRQALRDAWKQLWELGALSKASAEASLTPHGKQMSRLPMDVTLAHILLQAEKYDSLEPALVLAAFLSLQDIRVYPSESPNQEKARTLHARFRDKNSDFIGILKLWNFVWDELSKSTNSAQNQGVSGNALRKLCLNNFFHLNRLKEWMELTKQFTRLLKQSRDIRQIKLEKLNADGLHISLLSGFLSFVAKKNTEQEGYRLAGAGRETHIHPGSSLAKTQNEWVMAGEVRETSRAFLCTTAQIQPEWIEKVASHLCTQSYFNPLFNPKTGFVEAQVKTSFKGLEIQKSGRIHYDKINPELSADIFWREAIVGEQIFKPFAFLTHNIKSLQKLDDHIQKSRKSNSMPTEDELVEWYLERAPHVKNQKELIDFIAKNGNPTLQFSPDDWLQDPEIKDICSFYAPLIQNHSEKGASEHQKVYPQKVHFLGQELKVLYSFDHQMDWDGIAFEFPNFKCASFQINQLRLLSALYQHRLLDYALRYIPQTLQNIYSERTQRQKLAQEIVLAQQKFPQKSWIEIFRNELIVPALEAKVTLSLPKKWEKYLELHLLFASSNNTPIHIRISPDDSQEVLLQKIASSLPLNRSLWQAQNYFFIPYLSTEKHLGLSFSDFDLQTELLQKQVYQEYASKTDTEKKPILSLADSLKSRFAGFGFWAKHHSLSLATQLQIQGLEWPNESYKAKSHKELSSLKTLASDLIENTPFGQNHTAEGMAKVLLAASCSLEASIFLQFDKWYRVGTFSHFDRKSELFLNDLFKFLPPRIFDEDPYLATLVCFVWAREQKWTSSPFLSEEELMLEPLSAKNIHELYQWRSQQHKDFRKMRKNLRLDLRERFERLGSEIPWTPQLREWVDLFEKADTPSIALFLKIETCVQNLEMAEYRSPRIIKGSLKVHLGSTNQAKQNFADLKNRKQLTMPSAPSSDETDDEEEAPSPISVLKLKGIFKKL